MARPAWVSWSSGKDSAWALYETRRRGLGDVVGLLTTVDEGTGRVSIHGVPREVLEAQAGALGLPLVVVTLPNPCPNDVYEIRMAEAMRAARGAGVEAMVFGDLFLEEVRAYREDRLAGTGVDPLFPLWRRDTVALASEMLEAGVRAVVTSVDADLVDPDLVGRSWDRELLDALPEHADPCGERGEFHTCVLDGPYFGRAPGIGAALSGGSLRLSA